jgi:hypothetical protein
MRNLALAALIAALVMPWSVMAQDTTEAQEPVEEMMEETSAGEEEALVDTVPVVRHEFTGDSDNMRNFAVMESHGQLQSTIMLTYDVQGYAVVRLDSLTDSLVVDLALDLNSLTTGNSDKDTMVFHEDFLSFPDTAKMLRFSVLSPGKPETDQLFNEFPVELNGTGAIMMDTITDTVAATMNLTYLEGNEITATRLPGNLLHIAATFNFRLSDFGIVIPKEALLKLNDLIQVRFDLFCNEEVIEEPES